MKYPMLFEPVRIGGTLYRNRFFSAPTGHPHITREGAFSEDAIAYYERKAQGGCAAVTLGEAIVDSKYGRRHGFQAGLDSGNSKHTLAIIADRIRRHGAVPSIELQHSGMRGMPGINTPHFCEGSKIIYGPVEMDYEGIHVQQMPEELILEIIDKFADAAKNVQNMGFGMVTVHAGHGWLLNQFLTPRINTRDDKWGGDSVENRARMTVEVIDAIHRKCGRDFPVEVRISSSEVIDGGYTVEEGIAIAKQLDGHADIINCSVGCGIGLPQQSRTFSITHPCMFKEDGVNVKYAAEIRKNVRQSRIAAVGALSDPAMMESILEDGKADIIETARALICDPDLPNKARAGRDGEIRKCMRCFNCFSSLMNRGSFLCALNPETNRERSFDRNLIRPAAPQKVLVVGGGIGGMQAALTAAENGHEVILCEKTGRLGGHIRCEENVPFKKHLSEYIEQQERKVKSSSIDLRLNTEVTHDYAKSIGADVIIAALGARPVKPAIPGIDGENVLLADDAYTAPEAVGRKAVILGAGFVGTELAIYLHSLGRDVTVVEMAESFNPGTNVLHGRAVSSKLEEENIPVHFSNKAVRIDEKGVICETPEGEKKYPADTVIYAVGQKSLTEETAALYDCADYFFPVGDCIRPSTISDANLTAKSAALDIGRL